MNNAVFSLRLLPDNARRQVIKCFDVRQLIAFSLLSSNTKAMVQSLKVRMARLDVNAHHLLSISVVPIKLVIYQNGHNAQGRPLKSLDDIPYFVSVTTELQPHATFYWRYPKLSFVGWYKHIQSLFYWDDYNLFVNGRREIFDTAAFPNFLSEETTIVIGNVSPEYAQKLFKVFLPFANNFHMRYRDGSLMYPYKLGIQNFDFLGFPHQCHLNNILLSNATNALALDVLISDINRFLKCWMNGTNPRLVFAFINHRGPMNYDELLKGIKHRVMPNDLEREYLGDVLRGGVDIWNRRGIKATIVDRTINDAPYFLFNVWC